MATTYERVVLCAAAVKLTERHLREAQAEGRSALIEAAKLWKAQAALDRAERAYAEEQRRAHVEAAYADPEVPVIPGFVPPPDPPKRVPGRKPPRTAKPEPPEPLPCPDQPISKQPFRYSSHELAALAAFRAKREAQRRAEPPDATFDSWMR